MTIYILHNFSCLNLLLVVAMSLDMLDGTGDN